MKITKLGGQPEPQRGFPGGARGEALPAHAGDMEMRVQSLGREDPWRRRGGHSVQYSCLESPVDRGAWWAAVHRVAQSQTQLKRLNTRTH